MPLNPQGWNISSLPDTFNLNDPAGYFQHQLPGDLERDFDRARWGQYYKAPSHIPNRNAGTEQQTFAPPLTTRERRICSLNAPKTAQGDTICWDFNTHSGCSSPQCPRNQGGHVQFRNVETLRRPLKMYLLKKGV